MRIVHLIARLNNGGPARVIQQLCQEHRRAGHASVVLCGDCSDDEDDISGQLRAAGVRILRLAHMGRSVAPWHDCLALREITRQLRRLRPDLLHTHTAKAGLLGRWAARWHGVPCVHTYHGHVLSGYWGPARQGIIRHMERLSARYGHCHSLSPRLVQDLAQVHGIGHPRRWHTQAIPVAALQPSQQSRQALAAQWGWSDYNPAIPTIGFLGRLVPVKDPLLLCEVVAQVQREQPVQVLVCGDGPLRAATDQRLTALGIPHCCPGFQDSAAALSLFDVLVMTSHNEGLPLSIIEAAGLGVPVVAAGVGGIVDLPPGPALQVTPRQVDDLAQAVRATLNSQDQAAQQAHGRKVAELCDPALLAPAYLAMYRRVIADQRRE